MGIKYPVDKYYNLRKFKFLPMLYDDNLNNGAGYVEPKKKQNKLSHCTTCNHLRPPRSFHCSQCGVCVEVHDHHCPWVGTCIGYRNLSYFIAFLFWTAVHALTLLVLSIIIMYATPA
jgi:hypothetical protein